MIVIRSETEADRKAVFELTRSAFAAHEHSSHTEEFIIEHLRIAGALAISLVAERDRTFAGHVAFSRVAISDGSPDWYGLGPLSVLPSLQGKGVGKALVNAGLAALKASGARGCVLLGEPAYYSRFGFVSDPCLVLEGAPPEFFLCRSLGRGAEGEPAHAPSAAPQPVERARDRPVGTVAYHEAFAARG